MKNKISYIIITLLLLITTVKSIEARDYPYFEEDDYCGYHILGCQEVVTKCRFQGIDYCIYFEQVPCEEACGY